MTPEAGTRSAVRCPPPMVWLPTATVHKKCVTLGRYRTVGLFAAGALATLIGSGVAAYATSAFWETVPVVMSVLVFGAASAGAIYAATRRGLFTLAVAACLVVGQVVLLGAITLARWD